jgi:hypothetical protein
VASEYLRPFGSRKAAGKVGFLQLRPTLPISGRADNSDNGGDFNFVLAKADVTGHFNFSRALNTLVKGYDLVDMWATAPDRGVYTHYTRQGAEGLDRINVSRHLNGQKCATETAVTAFTDHLAVILRIALNVTTVRCDRSYWKMNAALLREADFQESLLQRWKRWRRQQTYYPHIVMWWERMVKNQLRKLLTSEGSKRRRDDISLEIFYYACLYDLLKRPTHHHEEGMAAVNHIQAKIVRLYSARLARGSRITVPRRAPRKNGRPFAT